MAPYEEPMVTDYGTLTELTASGNCRNADELGDPDTAFSAGQGCV